MTKLILMTINDFDSSLSIGFAYGYSRSATSWLSGDSIRGYSVYLGQKGMEHYPIVPKGVRYADNNSSILLALKLKADTEYEFILVGQKFTTPEGYPLIDYKVAFKTK